MTWIFYALGSAGFAALVAIFGKIGLKGADTVLATTVRGVVMGIFLIVISFSLGKFSQIGDLSNKALTFIILSGVAGALSWLCYFFAIKNGPVSGVIAIDRLSVVFAIALAAIFLGEALSAKIAIGGGLIVAGALLVAL